MGCTLRSILTTAAACLAATGLLQAQSEPWSGRIGAVLPSGGASQWVGKAIGPSIDIMVSYPMANADTVRMRFGYYALKGNRSDPQTLTLPATAPADYPANTMNELFGFTYGFEYLRALPLRFYALGGLGVAYTSATRKGTFNLTSVSSGTVVSNYGANSFAPYLCAGFGYQVNSFVAVEALYQASSVMAQTRYLDITSAGYGAPGQVMFKKLAVGTLSLGLTINF